MFNIITPAASAFGFAQGFLVGEKDEKPQLTLVSEDATKQDESPTTREKVTEAAKATGRVAAQAGKHAGNAAVFAGSAVATYEYGRGVAVVAPALPEIAKTGHLGMLLTAPVAGSAVLNIRNQAVLDRLGPILGTKATLINTGAQYLVLRVALVGGYRVGKRVRNSVRVRRTATSLRRRLTPRRKVQVRLVSRTAQA